MLDYSQIRARDFNPATGVIERENTSFRNFEHRTHAGGVNLNGLFDTGSISHNLLLGIDLKEEFKGLGALFTERVFRNGEKIEFSDIFGVRHIINDGLVIGFGAGDITYQLRGEF